MNDLDLRHIEADTDESFKKTVWYDSIYYHSMVALIKLYYNKYIPRSLKLIIKDKIQSKYHEKVVNDANSCMTEKPLDWSKSVEYLGNFWDVVEAAEKNNKIYKEVKEKLEKEMRNKPE